MAQLVAKQAKAAGHEIGAVITSADAGISVSALSDRIHGHDVAIDFSTAAAVEKNVTVSAHTGTPLVEGTTGWQSQLGVVCRLVADHKAALIYGANFSIGVNVFYRVVSQAAELFAQVSEYAPFIEEAHHERKRDAPSGTALRLQDLMKEKMQRDVPVASTRAGSIPGTHRVGFDSPADQVLLSHVARSRAAFAAGALLAANWIIGRRGVFEFSEMLNEKLGRNDE